MSGLINPVTTEAQLNADMVTLAGETSGSFTLDLANSIALSSDLEAVNLQSGVTLTIDGGGGTVDGVTIDGGGAYRGLFVYAGNVTIENLSLSLAVAIGGAGGVGTAAGGGGAGLGGGLFVASAGTVTLDNVDFADDLAGGGAGGSASTQANAPGGGGGGGLGGNGGNAARTNFYTGAGGGGVGAAGAGAGATAHGGAGIVPNASGGGARLQGTTGYAAAGSGGGGASGLYATHTLTSFYVLGGGGGIGGAVGSFVFAKAKAYGGAGGFGGGGGGGAGVYGGVGGQGGFGGGGGGYAHFAIGSAGGAGGFGGGGGGGSSTGGAAGMGGGNGGCGSPAAGGGGLGAGGDVFVQQGGRLVVQSGSWSGGIAMAGVAGSGGAQVAQAGQAAGGGMFLQGNEIVFLQPGAGQTLTIADQISDEMGSFGTADTNSGGLVIGPGSVRLLAVNDFTAGARIDPGGTLELAAAASMGDGSLVFGGPVAGEAQEMILDSAAVFGNLISAFTPSDTIDLTQLAYQSGGFSGSYSGLGRGGTLTIDASPANVTLHFSGAIFTFDKFRFAPDSGTGTLVELACYAAGTRILTASGECAVETMHVGDLVPDLVARRLRRVTWIGCTTISLGAHLRPADGLPVRVRRGAFGPGMPHRDLVVSPDHALFLDGQLVPVRRLIDGRRIVQEQADRVTYWHVALDSHGVLLAEGLPAESYLACGDRAGFAGGPGPALLAAARREARACATLGMRRRA